VTAGKDASVSCCWLIYGGCRWRHGGVCVLVSNNFFPTKHTTAALLELILMTIRKLWVCTGGGGGGGSQQREVADGADVVFTDTAY